MGAKNGAMRSRIHRDRAAFVADPASGRAGCV